MTQPRINTEQVQYILSHKVIFEDFSPLKQYAPSNVIKYGDNLYLSKVHIEPGEFNPSDWFKIYNSDDVDALVAEINSEIEAEETRARAAEAQLQANITAEETARISEDEILQDNIDAEESARIEQDLALQQAIADEQTRAENAEDALDDKIDTEISRATTAEATLQSNITAEQTRATTAEGVLQSNINAEASARASADSTLQDNIDAEAETRALADQALNDLIDSTGDDLDAEIARATAAEAQLQSNIDDVQINLNTESARAIARENEIEASSIQESVVPDVVSNVELVQESVLLALKKTTKNTNTGATSATQTPFQMVNENQNGMMTKEAYNQIYNNDSRIATLEGASKRYPVHLGTGSHTQAEYQAAWETASGSTAGTTPPDGSTLVNLDNNHAITYFANAQGDKWIDRGIDTVTLATQSTPGIVQGSLDNGKIYAEADGTMSLNGYDSLVAEDIRLDGVITQEIADRIADVDAEETRAKGIESGLRSDLTAEITRATTAETTENTRATTAEANLQSQINDLDSDLDDEILARTTGDSNLNTYIGNVETALNTEISDRIADVNAEETRAKGIEAGLQTQIDTLTTNLATEVSTRGNADIALQNNIDQEIQDREDAVEAEELARKTADGLLSDSISTLTNNLATEVSRATAAEAGLQSDIDDVASDLSDEVTRATTAEGTLQSNIDTVSGDLAQEILDRVADVDAEETRAKGIESSLQSQINTVSGDLAQEVTDRTDADTGLQNQIDDLDDDLTAEVTRATNAESTLQGNISDVADDLSDEVTRATGVESGLQDQIDTLDGATDQLETDLAAEVTRATNAEGTLQSNINTVSGNLTQEIADRTAAVSGVRTDLDDHIANTSNPHSVTKAQVGLGNVDNTSDANKPISTATQNALNLKADKSYTDTELAKKQDTLVSGTNIKTINSESLLGSTDIQLQTKLSGTADNVVIYTNTTGTLGELGFDSVPTQNSDKLLRSGVIWSQLRNKINYSDIVNDVVTGGVAVPLSAEQGKELNTKINLAMQSTHDRGVVLNALTSQEQNYSITSATVNAGGTNYVVGDTLMLTSDLYVDGIIIVSSVNSSGAITGINLGQAGAFSTNPAGSAVSFVGGSGSGATFTITAALVDNKTLLDIANPQQNDFATVLQDEIHNNLRFVWKYADLDGDGNYEWVSGYPITTEERNFTEDPIKSTELASNAVVTEKIADNNVTSTKLADNSIISRHVTNGTILDRHVGELAAIQQSKIAGLVDALASKASAATTYTKTEVDNLLDDKLDITDAASTYATITNLNAHTSNTSNPHNVTKAQVGLSNVDNTSDADKPVSTAQQTALNLKADKSTTYTKTQVDDALALKLDSTTAASTYATQTSLSNHTSNTSNPHSVTKAQIGLGNVDNTSDANKPVSTAQQTALNLKVNKAGDTMTGNLEITGGGIYLESIGSAVAQSVSRLNLGTPNNVYAYLTGNTSGAFGIYSEKSGTRTGIACYPGTNFFADATTKTIDLGRSNNVWKIGYINSLSDGTNSISTADIVTNINTTLPNGISTNAGAISTINTTLSGYGDVVTHDADEFATAAQGTKADSALQSGDNVSELTNNAGYITKSVNNLDNYTLSSALAAVATTGTLVSLNDTDITSPTQGQHLVFDGTKWKNTTSSASVSWGGITGTLSDQTDLQNELDAKQDTITGAATTVVSDNLFQGRALVSDGNGKIAVSGVTSTELATLSGVSSNVQTQLNAKANQSTTYTKTEVDTAVGAKVSKVSTANKVYGTDSTGAQTTYDVNSFGAVDDVQVDGTSVVSNKIASLGSMAGENTTDYSTKAVADTLYAAKSLETTVSNHTSNTSNPHSVTKAQVGLGNVDNTSDANKPISTATQAALDLKANQSTTYTKTEVDNAISAAVASAVRYKGTVANYSDLPTSGNVVGDMWNITNADSSHGIKAGDNVVWNGTSWDNQGGTVDLSNYYTKSQTYSKTEADTLLGNKANSSDVYTKSQTYTKTEVDTALGNKANSSDVYTKSETYTKTEVNTIETNTVNKIGTKLIAGTMPLSGAALLANQMVFMNSNKVYPATNSSVAIEPGFGIQLNTTALNSSTAVVFTNLRQKGVVSSLTNIPHDTIARGNPLYFRCHLDSNNNIISDNYVATSMSAGYTWYYIGVASSSSEMMIDTTQSQFITLDANSKVTHINGKELYYPTTVDAYTKAEMDAKLALYRTSANQDTIDSGKADKATPSTAGNIAVLTTDGNLSDGGTLGSLAHLSSITESNISGTLSQSKITNLTTDLSTINTTLGNKANSADVYTKSQTYTKTEVDTALSGKQNTLTAGDNITIVNNTISATGAMVKFRDWYEE
ncbi:hypothetical protein J6W34_00020 [bacterium]|nr:hypothetical protein [bacterium]